ncbi:MAG: LysM peptidoglycan-binding domain-containing protein [Patescibacteria group bacterium]
MSRKNILIVLIVLTALISLNIFKNESPSLSMENFQFTNPSDLFLSSIEKFSIESPDLLLIQKNSLRASMPPTVFSPQVLGSLVGTSVESTARNYIIEYVVESGDTLSVIANNNNISLNSLLWANDLTQYSKIKVGQKLVIPPVSGIIYVVKKGDTLSQIVEKYKGSVQEIVEFNKLSSESDIFIGDIVVIPGGKMPEGLTRIVSIPVGASYFIYPCEGTITQGLHGDIRNAVDIANKCGKPIIASASGIVQRSGTIWIGGQRITILHPNGVVTYYGHLSKIFVTSGQEVRKGDIIGLMGNTGYTIGVTGCHLHFDVRGTANFLGGYSVGTKLSW